MSDLSYWIVRAQWASAFGYPAKEAYARRKIKQLSAQGIAAGTDETLKAAQPEGQEPGPKDAPGPSSCLPGCGR